MNAQLLSLPPATQSLLRDLHGALRPAWAALPSHSGPELAIPAYQAAPVPENLRGRQVELIVEASDGAALERALRSDADALVLDFDDTFAPTRQNVQAAYNALLRLGQAPPQQALLIRPRALYALEPHLDFDGPAIAALCDLVAALCPLRDRPPHLYIPKLETVPEAQFWQQALTFVERRLELPENSLRVCLQIETFSGLRYADALLFTLHQRAYGLNAGRWDYVFSLIKELGKTRQHPIAPRRELTMDVDAMLAYAEELVRICRERGAQAIGGTASLAPDPSNPQATLDAVTSDKQREAAQGFTAAWAGLPALLGAVRRGFAERPLVQVAPANPDLYARLTKLPAPAPLAVADVQDAIALALSVFDAWYGGRGVVERHGRIEDTATAELARAQLWQWIHVEAELDDETRLTPERYLRERRAAMGDTSRAARLLDALVLSRDCPDYFPRVAQQWTAPAGVVQ